MRKKVVYYGLSLFLIHILAGCGSAGNGSDSITIISVNPASGVSGEKTSFNVAISYTLVSKDTGELGLGFNSYSSGSYLMSNRNQLVSKGSGTAIFSNISTIPRAWAGSTEFKVDAILSEYPHDSSWSPLAYSTQSINVTH